MTPGGLLSPNAGDELTPDEELVVQSIAAGAYFIDPVVPTGAVDGVNTIFTLPSTPNPAGSVVFLINGQFYGSVHFTLVGAVATLDFAPDIGMEIYVFYRKSPV